MKEILIIIGKCVIAIVATIVLMFVLVLPEALLEVNDFLRPYIGSIGVISIYVLIIAFVVIVVESK